MEVIRNDCKWNYVTHLIFPARTWIKELIYWPTELAAAVLFFIYIVQMKLTDYQLYSGKDMTVTTKVIESNISGTKSIVDGRIFGISYTSSNQAMIISEMDTDLLNREYAWICLCYIVKHFLYSIDFFLLYKRKFCRVYDFATPLLNFALWVLWGIYGWTQEGFAIHGGMYLRFRKDIAYARPINGLNEYKALEDELKLTQNTYDSLKSWQWLWIICAIVWAGNTLLWFYGLSQKRSSAFTGQALSTIAIPAQLFFLHLFLKGSWIRSNWPTLFIDSSSGNKAWYTKQEDYYEARWVWFIIYIAAYAGAAFSLACLIKAYFFLTGPHKNVMKGFKYVLYSLLWADGLVWILFLDATLYHYFIEY